MNFVSLFSGIGGLDLGLERAGFNCIAQVEIDPFCRRVLAKHWPHVPKFEDVRTFGKDSISGPVDLIAGGFPCQDISNAGSQAGIDGKRSGLWSEFYRIICEIQPRFILLENVAALLVRGMGRVLGNLAAGGFDAEWECLQASAFGHHHDRDRLFCVAYCKGSVPGVFSGSRRQWRSQFQLGRLARSEAASRWPRERFEGEPDLAPLVDGIPDWVGRCGIGKGLGNAVVPQVAEWIGHRIMAAVARAELIHENTYRGLPSPASTKSGVEA